MDRKDARQEPPRTPEGIVSLIDDDAEGTSNCVGGDDTCNCDSACDSACHSWGDSD